MMAMTEGEERTIDEILVEFARAGRSRAAETASLLNKLPARPEVLNRFLELATERGLGWVRTLAVAVLAIQDAPAQDAPAATPTDLVHDPAPATTPEGLAALLASDATAEDKTAALTRAVRERQPNLLATIRARLKVETDPDIIAALASCLGTVGQFSDGRELAPLLTHSDRRISATSVESLFRLKVPVTVGLLEKVLASGQNGCVNTARGLLGSVENTHALQLLSELSAHAEPEQRARVAELLGLLADRPGTTELLLTNVAREDRTVTLEALSKSIIRHASPSNCRALVGPLLALRDADPARAKLFDVAVAAICTSTGLPVAEAEAIGAGYATAHPVPTKIRSTRKSRTLPSPGKAPADTYELRGDRAATKRPAGPGLGVMIAVGLALLTALTIAITQALKLHGK